jgi:hypothetical protein
MQGGSPLSADRRRRILADTSDEEAYLPSELAQQLFHYSCVALFAFPTLFETGQLTCT